MDKPSTIEVRPDELGIDEIVASGVDVHLERMSNHEYALIIETEHETACFAIRTPRALIRCSENWREERK